MLKIDPISTFLNLDGKKSCENKHFDQKWLWYMNTDQLSLLNNNKSW